MSLNWVMVFNCSGNGLWPVYWQLIAWLNTNQLVQLDLKEQQCNWNKMPRISRQCIWKWRLQAESHFTWPICIKSTFYPGHNVLTNCILQCPHETKHQMAFWLPLWKFLFRFSFSYSMFNQNHACLTMFNLSVMYQNVAYLYFLCTLYHDGIR